MASNTGLQTGQRDPSTNPGLSVFSLGVDENGLGSLLGPMVVTAVMAELSPAGQTKLNKRLRGNLALDLGDSKALVRFGKMALAEAWCRALHPEASCPSALFEALSHTALARLRRRCPNASAQDQCLSLGRAHPTFTAPPPLVKRIAGHLKRWEQQGIRVRRVESEIVCAAELNAEKSQGGNRFVSDLHAMERLILRAHAAAGTEIRATCGKVGGIANYEAFFGPLAESHTETLQHSRSRSAYRFGDLGEVVFAQDADSEMPLVMLASLVGKYVRELTMGTISAFYGSRMDGLQPVSGYHDPKTRRFQLRTVDLRRQHAIPDVCFER